MSARAGAGEDPLAAGDAVAAELLAGLEPLRFREAADEGERLEAFRLRYRAVVELGMAPAETFPEGLERDELDDSAVQILGWDGEVAIATCRLVPPAPGRPLPMEEAFGIRVEGAEATVEWGRVVVDPHYRGDGHSVLMGLAARGWLAMRERDFTRAIGATPRRLMALFEALGFEVTVLGLPRTYWGEERYPILCDADPAVRRLERQWLSSPASPPEGSPPG